jgi:hypothetical protein
MLFSTHPMGGTTLENADTESRLEAVLRADAQEVARRTLRYKFGRLSNRRILATLKAALPGDASAVDDAALLDRWFAEYASAVDRMRNQQAPASQAS